MKVIKDVTFAFFIGIIFYFLNDSFIHSTYLIDFIKNNFVMLLIALLAINSTTLALILTKIRELMDKIAPSNDVFARTKKEMLFSIKEHITLIVIALLFLILREAPCIIERKPCIIICDVVLIGSLVYSLMMLYDISKSAFVILNFNHGQPQK